MSQARRQFPTGVPVVPPPGWRPRIPPPPPPRPLPPPVAPFRAQVGLVLKALLLSLLVIVCMGVGWLLTQGRRPHRTPADPSPAVVQAAPKKERDEPRPAPRPDDPPSQDNPEREKAKDSERPSEPRKEDPLPPRPAPPPDNPPRSDLTYEKHILPIMERACLNCHGASRKRGGLDLRTYAALVRGGDSGTGVVPGKPDDSPLYETIASNRMPPGKRKLPAADKQRIREWILRGAAGNRAAGTR